MEEEEGTRKTAVFQFAVILSDVGAETAMLSQHIFRTANGTSWVGLLFYVTLL